LLSVEGVEQHGPISSFLPDVAAVLGLPSNSELEGLAIQQLNWKGMLKWQGICLSNWESSCRKKACSILN
jgi:hypothetical protein